jgi:hypothetical protein
MLTSKMMVAQKFNRSKFQLMEHVQNMEVKAAPVRLLRVVLNT